MNEVGIRVVNRAGPQASGMLSRRSEASNSARPLWPFTVRASGQRRPPADKGPDAKPSLNFTT
jgi:hypothetical protein